MDIIERVRAMRAEVRAEYEAATKRAEELRAVLAELGEVAALGPACAPARHDPTQDASSPAQSSHAPTLTLNPAPPNGATRKRGALERWRPLLNSLREIVSSRGPLQGSVRTLAEMCPDELKAAGSGWSNMHGPEVRGLGLIVASYARTGKPLCGMRFRSVGPAVVSELHGTYAIYLVEAA